MSSTDDPMYASPAKARDVLTDAYNAWSGGLGTLSIQCCFAVIAANWAVFQDVDGIRSNPWAAWSMVTVLGGLGLMIILTWWITERTNERIAYARDNNRWQNEYDKFKDGDHAWPYTDALNRIARRLRSIKTWTPVIASLMLMQAILASADHTPRPRTVDPHQTINGSALHARPQHAIEAN